MAANKKSPLGTMDGTATTAHTEIERRSRSPQRDRRAGSAAKGDRRTHEGVQEMIESAQRRKLDVAKCHEAISLCFEYLKNAERRGQRDWDDVCPSVETLRLLVHVVERTRDRRAVLEWRRENGLLPLEPNDSLFELS
jgi:hypothetical protein